MKEVTAKIYVILFCDHDVFAHFYRCPVPVNEIRNVCVENVIQRIKIKRLMKAEETAAAAPSRKRKKE